MKKSKQQPSFKRENERRSVAKMPSADASAGASAEKSGFCLGVGRKCEKSGFSLGVGTPAAETNAEKSPNKLEILAQKLDLSEHFAALSELFARPKDLFLQGDLRLHKERTEQFAALDVALPKSVAPCASALVHLQKMGVLHLQECLEFFKMLEYFRYLKSLAFDGKMAEYLSKIIFPDEISQALKSVKNSALDEEADERFAAIKESERAAKDGIRSQLGALLRSLGDYLIDSNLHFISGKECLLLRAGFSKACGGQILARSQNGGFYVLPNSVERFYKNLEICQQNREEIYYEYACKFSEIFRRHHRFLSFINKEFDLVDAYAARAAFARMNDLNFFLPGKEFDLKDFSHPALADAKPISARLEKSVLIITGVNAGGKSMMLKSLLAASLMSKYLIPFRAHPGSRLRSFKDYFAIIADEQNSANNISTFAARMRAFSEVFGHKNFLLGVDEIELGTDFEEAAVLFYELICALQNDGVIVITTHHKRLAMLLASKSFCQLLAALYDEEAERPKFEFLEGIIGKSYAFETAARYGVPAGLIKLANEHFSEQEKSLNEMLNKNLELDAKLKMQLASVEEKERALEAKLERAKEAEREQKERFKAQKIQLEREFLQAIDAAKKTLDFSELKDKQRQINAANEAFKRACAQQEKPGAKVLKIGDKIRYENIKAKILSIDKNSVSIEANGMKMRVSKEAIERCNDAVFERPAPPVVRISAAEAKKSVANRGGAGVKLDLHGLRAEEAIERCDKFISDALVAGFSEVMIFHGIGTGALARAIKEFLSAHPSVKEFCDAPRNQGGFGAKIVRF